MCKLELKSIFGLRKSDDDDSIHKLSNKQRGASEHTQYKSKQSDKTKMPKHDDETKQIILVNTHAYILRKWVHVIDDVELNRLSQKLLP